MTILAPDRMTSAPDQNAAARAAIESTHQKPDAPGLSHVDKRAAVIGSQLDKARQGWEALNRGVPVDKVDATRVINSAIGTRNEKGERVVNPQTERQINFLSPLQQEFNARGFEGLSGEQKKFMVDEVRNVLLATDEGQSMATENPARFENHILNHLKNPDFARTFAGQYNALIESSRNATNSVPETRIELRDAQDAERSAAVAYAVNAAEIRIADAALSQYEDRSLQLGPDGLPGRKGPKLDELERLDKEIPELREKEGPLNDDLARASGKLARLENRAANGDKYADANRTVDVNVAIEQAENEKIRIQNEITKINKAVSRRDDLVAEQERARTRSGELQIQQATLTSALRNTTEDLSLAQTSYEEARDNRTADEAALVDNLRNLAANSAKEYFLKRTKDAIAIQDDVDAEERAKLTSESEKVALDELKRSYDRGKPQRLIAKSWLTKRMVDKGLVLGEFNAGLINNDFYELLIENNPAQILKRKLWYAQNEDGYPRYTEEDVASLMQDEAFVKKWSMQTVQRILKAKASIGGATIDEAEIIANSDWGQMALNEATKNPDALQKAIEGNPEAKDIVEELAKEHNTKDIKELLKKVGGKGLLELIMAILGTVVIVGAKNLGAGASGQNS